MSDAVLVSVVIATRDRLEMLREAVAAVHAQDIDAVVESILVFDQSAPDRSFESTDARRPVRVVANTHTPGLPGARNSGVDAAVGEFVAFCDDDDLWLPGKLTAQVAAARAAADVSIVTCGIVVDYEGQLHERRLPTSRIHLADLVRDRHTELHPSTFLIPAATFRDRIGPVSEEIPGGFGEDYELLLRAARVAPIVNVPDVHVTIRWHAASFFFRRWEMMAGGLGWILERYPEFAGDGRGFARVQAQVAFAHASMGLRRTALAEAWRATRRAPLEPRAPLAVLVAIGLLRPSLVMRTLHRFGKGI